MKLQRDLQLSRGLLPARNSSRELFSDCFLPRIAGKNNHRPAKGEREEKQKKDMKQTIQQQIVTANQFLFLFFLW
jgi:hypothetical protein